MIERLEELAKAALDCHDWAIDGLAEEVGPLTILNLVAVVRAADSGLAALESCKSGDPYKDIDGDWVRSTTFDAAKVKSAIAALRSALEALET